ncbi:aaa atpase family protein [Fusarium austroafricanum]|uniref:Aaa atpase family protein n=1 Tax=Fusarium austroafricanum TaxID=2364996 RepID=A0A8H4NL62_9HYPO|nr:aaa atpase family protein [Fusarium austroafricanum]
MALPWLTNYIIYAPGLPYALWSSNCLRLKNLGIRYLQIMDAYDAMTLDIRETLCNIMALEGHTQMDMLRDPQECLKLCMMTKNCGWAETYLRTIECSSLGTSGAHMLRNTNQESINTWSFQNRRLVSKPDILYGWIPICATTKRVLPMPLIWACEGSAISGKALVYPFLIVNFGGNTIRNDEIIPDAAFECMKSASVAVRMVEKLKHRLAQHGYRDGGSHLGLSSVVFSIELNENTAQVYFTYAWDETTENVCLVANFIMSNDAHRQQCNILISRILHWGTTTRHQGIINAIGLIDVFMHSAWCYPTTLRRRALRTAVFDTLATSQDTFDSVFVFTDFSLMITSGSSVMAEYRAMAARRGCTFVPVTLICSKEENLHRLVSPERSIHGKLTDMDLVTHIRDNSVVHQSPTDGFRMELDLTDLQPDMAAHMIYEHVLKVCGSQEPSESCDVGLTMPQALSSGTIQQQPAEPDFLSS